MDDLEEALVAWGRRWRNGEAPAGRVRVPTSWTDRHLPLTAVWSPTAVLVAVVIVLLVWLGTALKPNSAAGWLREGMSVTGTGYLIDPGSGEVQLCIGGLSRQTGRPSCSVVAVAVEGVKWDTVPQATHLDGSWYARDVTVRGVWTGSAVKVGSITAAPQSKFPAVPYPCAGQEGEGAGLGTADEEAALASLNGEVFGNPDRYAGLWRAASADGLGRIVVDVVGDPSQAESKLRRLYPYPLCLVAARFTETELKTTLFELGQVTKDWRAEVDYPRNRVVVSVTVRTEAVEQRLQPYLAQVWVSQLLEPT